MDVVSGRTSEQISGKMCLVLRQPVGAFAVSFVLFLNAFAQEIPPVTKLPLGGTFSVPAAEGTHVRQVVAANGMLTWLASSRNSAELLQTTLQGEVKARLPLPGTARQFALDELGNVVVLASSGSARKILEFRIDGTSRETSTRRRLSHVAFLGGQVVAWEQDQFVLRPAGSAEMVVATGLQPDLVSKLPGERLAAIDGKQPLLSVLDEYGRVSSRTTLSAPDFRAAPALAEGAREVILYSMAVDRRGRIFCAVSPYRGKEGAVIVEFDDSGVLRNRFLAELPAFPETEGRRDGRMLVSHIAVDHGMLFIGSSVERRCAYYRLPEKSGGMEVR